MDYFPKYNHTPTYKLSELCLKSPKINEWQHNLVNSLVRINNTIDTADAFISYCNVINAYIKIGIDNYKEIELKIPYYESGMVCRVKDIEYNNKNILDDGMNEFFTEIGTITIIKGLPIKNDEILQDIINCKIYECDCECSSDCDIDCSKFWCCDCKFPTGAIIIDNNKNININELENKFLQTYTCTENRRLIMFKNKTVTSLISRALSRYYSHNLCYDRCYLLDITPELKFVLIVDRDMYCGCESIYESKYFGCSKLDCPHNYIRKIFTHILHPERKHSLSILKTLYLLDIFPMDVINYIFNISLLLVYY